MKSLPRKLKIYLATLFSITPIVYTYFLYSSYLPRNHANVIEILFFSILSAITESYSVNFMNFNFSPTFAISFACLILFDPHSTVIIMALGFLMRTVKIQGKYRHIFNTPIYKTLFNVCIFALSAIWGSYISVYSGKTFGSELIVFSVFPVAFFFLNTLFIAILNSLLTKKNIIYSFITNVKLGFLNILVISPFGAILAFVYQLVVNKFGQLFGLVAVSLFLFPILLARYTFALYIEVKSKYVQTVDILMRAMEARDNYTEGHSHRVAELVSALARQLKLSEAKIEQLNFASLLHDVGKIGIDDRILNKPGKLTIEEYEIIKQHPVIGYNILKDIKDFKEISALVKHHHERYDGKGYPDGKTVQELGLDVFIIQLADSVDAMITNRPYRDALNRDIVINELIKNRGTQFHPDVVDAYIKISESQNL